MNKLTHNQLPQFLRQVVGDVLIKNGSHFAGVFYRTLEQVPQLDRWKILRHWARRRRGPRIYLVPVVDLFTLARTSFDGHRIVFRQAAVEAMPDDVARTAIAHELGHVLRIAKKLASNTDPRAEEQKVRQLLDRWQFPEDVLDRWLVVNEPMFRTHQEQIYLDWLAGRSRNLAPATV